jgi:hypothetical protein
VKKVVSFSLVLALLLTAVMAATLVIRTPFEAKASEPVDMQTALAEGTPFDFMKDEYRLS